MEWQPVGTAPEGVHLVVHRSTATGGNTRFSMLLDGIWMDFSKEPLDYGVYPPLDPQPSYWIRLPEPPETK